MDAISDKQQGVNFSLCEHKTVSSTQVSADKTFGTSEARYYFSQVQYKQQVKLLTHSLFNWIKHQ